MRNIGCQMLNLTFLPTSFRSGKLHLPFPVTARNVVQIVYSYIPAKLSSHTDQYWQWHCNCCSTRPLVDHDRTYDNVINRMHFHYDSSLSVHYRRHSAPPASDISRMNRKIMIPLLPVERYLGNTRLERLISLVRLTDDKEYVAMTHSRSLGVVFCDVSPNRIEDHNCY